MPEQSLETLQVRVLSSSTPRIPCGPCYLVDIIQDAEQGEHFMVEAASTAYLLILTEIDAERSLWSASDALRFCAMAMQRLAPSAVCLFDDNGAPKPEARRTRALSLLSISDHAAASVGSWPAGLSATKFPPPQHQLFTWLPRSKLQQHRRKLCWLALALLLLAVVAAAASLSTSSTSGRYWQRYDTRGSQGPKYQLQFTHHNVSEWAARYPQSNGDDDTWFLRIDDQAMVPAGLVDADERRYQRWFRQRYPDADHVRLAGDYLAQAFLSDPAAIQVPVDRAFHMAHCVLAVRRYWIARETGRHVCPRDIDYKHMKHCIDALDMWAFPEGPRRSTLPPGGAAHGSHHGGDAGKAVVDESDETRLVWRTKICFD
ncbi:hypothetical protein SLS54_009360 [Diplodia seriata]